MGKTSYFDLKILAAEYMGVNNSRPPIFKVIEVWFPVSLYWQWERLRANTLKYTDNVIQFKSFINKINCNHISILSILVWFAIYDTICSFHWEHVTCIDPLWISHTKFTWFMWWEAISLLKRLLKFTPPHLHNSSINYVSLQKQNTIEMIFKSQKRKGNAKKIRGLKKYPKEVALLKGIIISPHAYCS